MDVDKILIACWVGKTRLSIIPIRIQKKHLIFVERRESEGFDVFTTSFS